jgi:hypothetical protein
MKFFKIVGVAVVLAVAIWTYSTWLTSNHRERCRKNCQRTDDAQDNSSDFAASQFQGPQST